MGFDFENLSAALSRYQKTEKHGGWPLVPSGPKLELGMNDPRVGTVRMYLLLTGDLPKNKTQDENYFDETLKNAVSLFQTRHGLLEDGIIGATTVKAMQVPLEIRMQQLKANIAREQEMKQPEDPAYILINIPAFELYLFEQGQRVMEMRTVVGRANWETPLFEAKITGILLNPSWNVPSSIVKKEILRKIKKDPDYLSAEEIQTFKKEGEEWKELDPKTIDWAERGLNLNPFKFQQKPGPKNALGRIKFIMPNTFDIYLHDTPSREFFKQPQRGLSHGCIRVEKPVDLALHLLKDLPQWNRAKIHKAIDDGKEIMISLPEGFPMYLTYTTAWIDKDHQLHFREDIYKKDGES
ncbi:MAG: L,D-transpeptidase family protein [Deltaproteobacteria bacterium]|nr:L,D-transpeptidase family protein [Deltaproteobacteria bacterium]